jgi:formate hydrogenlyase subunit 3/multisubunit Na+/H+ antiporter MnhD subunit
MNWIAAFFIIPVIAILVIPFFNVKWKGIATVLMISANAVLSSVVAADVFMNQPLEMLFNGNQVTGPISVRIDGLSAWFMLIINFVFVMGTLYGLQYMKAYQKQSKHIALHCIVLIILHTAMISLCGVQNSLVFLIFWEVMAVSAFLALIFENEKIATIQAGVNYLIQSHIAIVFLMMGFIWVAIKTNSFDFNAIATYTASHASIKGIALFLLFFIGFGLKAGFIPLHTWLPHAHPAAPSHVSAIMSALIVKMGVFGIVRILFLIHANYLVLAVLVLLVSMATGLYGILNAALHRDIKRMLAYCTIENIGIIGIGIGVGLTGMHYHTPLLILLGFGGALLHVVNHALFKSLLFFAAGAVYRKAHSRDMDKLGGLVKQMPFTFAAFLIGAIAIAGIPPFNGFVSEFMIYNGLLAGMKSGNMSLTIIMVLAFGALSVIGGLSVMTFTKTIGAVFLGTHRSELPKLAKEVSGWMLLPQYLTIAAMLVVAFLPVFFLNGTELILSQLSPFVGVNDYLLGDYGSNVLSVTLTGMLFIAVIVVLWFARRVTVKHLPTAVQPTWGCAYEVPNERMQYTGKSFSKALGKTLNFITIEKKHFTELYEGEIFPHKRTYLTVYLDFVEERIIDPLITRLLYFVKFFKFIQNGRIQSYVLYGVIFILSVFLFTYFNTLLSMWNDIVGGS